MTRRLPGFSYQASAPLRCPALEHFGDPHLDDRLPRDPESLGFAVKRLDHPGGEIDVDPARSLVLAASLRQFQSLLAWLLASSNSNSKLNALPIA